MTVAEALACSGVAPRSSGDAGQEKSGTQKSNQRSSLNPSHGSTLCLLKSKAMLFLLLQLIDSATGLLVNRLRRRRWRLLRTLESR